MWNSGEFWLSKTKKSNFATRDVFGRSSHIIRSISSSGIFSISSRMSRTCVRVTAAVVVVVTAAAVVIVLVGVEVGVQ